MRVQANRFTIAVVEKDATALKRNVAMQRGLGIETSVLEPSEIAKLQPGVNVSDLAAGACEPRSGYADPVDTTRSFAAAAEKLGSRCLSRRRWLRFLKRGQSSRG